MTVTAKPLWPHELYGSWLALDFANTLDARGQTPHEENLFGYADLVQWGWYADVVSADEAKRLARRAETEPRRAQAAYRRSLQLREAIYRTFFATARGDEPAADDLALVVQFYAEAMQHARLAPVKDSCECRWRWDEDDDLDRIWWPIARSAAELATSGPVERVKICASDEGCAGLFVDASKNRSRRWCSMDSCGVEHKIKAQNARRRSTAKRN